MGVYEKDTCSIPTEKGKYIPVQTSCEITGEVLIETSDKTISRLVLPDIFTMSRRNWDVSLWRILILSLC